MTSTVTTNGFVNTESPAAKRAVATPPASVRHFSNHVITDACLYILYGKIHYPTSTLVKSSTETLYSKTTRTVIPATITSTVTDVKTSTFTFVPTVTDTMSVTTTATSPIPVPTFAGATCDGDDSTLTCTYEPAGYHDGLQSTFVAPCDGSMSVQIVGANGGNVYQNGAAPDGSMVESQIILAGSSEITQGTSFDVYLCGSGYSPYYEQSSAGGFNGGGSGNIVGNAYNNGAGGGGASDIRYKDERLVVAGGGGGDGNEPNGNPGGNCGVNGSDSSLVASGSEGEDATNAGSSGGGVGYLGGSQGVESGYGGCGGFTGSSYADKIMPNTVGGAQAVITYTCSA